MYLLRRVGERVASRLTSSGLILFPTGYMDDTPRYEDADMEWLYSHSEADVGDSGTHGLDDPHSGTGATQGEQFEDPTTRVLLDKEIWTISTYAKNTNVYIYNIKLYIYVL